MARRQSHMIHIGHIPQTGFRAGSDAVLLAAAVSGTQTILDVGCGVGTAGLCVLHRLPHAQLWGIELQQQLYELAVVNAETNGASASATFIQADIGDRTGFRGAKGPGDKPFLECGFDHVITNPPFYQKGRARAATSDAKTIAHIEGDINLNDWLQFCLARTRPKGSLSVIHRADRLGDILAAISAGCGQIKIIPLWPEAAVSAKRVIVQAIKGDRGPMEITRGVILHEKDGTPTAAADRLLRGGAALNDLL